jgi:hypothetical protein
MARCPNGTRKNKKTGNCESRTRSKSKSPLIKPRNINDIISQKQQQVKDNKITLITVDSNGKLKKANAKLYQSKLFRDYINSGKSVKTFHYNKSMLTFQPIINTFSDDKLYLLIENKNSFFVTQSNDITNIKKIITKIKQQRGQ